MSLPGNPEWNKPTWVHTYQLLKGLLSYKSWEFLRLNSRMVELQKHLSPPSDPPHDPLPPPPSAPASPPPQPGFNPSRMIGIIRRKAMIKELAAIYHAECLTYCQELLELQKKAEESLIEMRTAEDSRREAMRPPKRMRKAR